MGTPSLSLQLLNLGDEHVFGRLEGLIHYNVLFSLVLDLDFLIIKLKC